MFEFAVLQEPVSSKQRDAIRQVIDRRIQAKTFTYTELLMCPEPARTMGLEYLDGVQSANGFPAVSGQPVNIGPVRLICLDKNDTIKVSRWGRKNIYGTLVEAPPQKFTVDLGNDALVDDSYPDRQARNVLRKGGFPSRDVASRGANSGRIVELKWLEQRAKEPDAPEEILSLHRQILERITAPAEAPPLSAPKSKSAGPASANP